MKSVYFLCHCLTSKFVIFTVSPLYKSASDDVIKPKTKKCVFFINVTMLM